MPRQRFYSDVDRNSHRSHGCLLLCHLKGSLHCCGCHLYGCTRSRLVARISSAFPPNRLQIIVSGNISCHDIRPLVFGMDGVQNKNKKQKLASILGAVILESKQTKTTNKQKSLNSKYFLQSSTVGFDLSITIYLTIVDG